MSKTHAHSLFHCFRNRLLCPVEFRSDSHNLNVSAGRLPQTIEQRSIWLEKTFWRMHASTRVAQERTLQMNAERASSQPTAIRPRAGLNGVCEAVQCTEYVVERC